MKELGKLFKIIDNNLLRWLFIGFIFIVPLWPKLPLRMINYTYIAIRAEDLYLSLLAAVFLIQVIRRRVSLNRQFLILFLIFWFFVFLSFAWNTFVTKTIEHLHLGLLHSLRRVEYMIVFFIGLSLIKNKNDFFQMMRYFFVAIFLVCLYGLGQKFLNFPAVQTMNPEYAKGYLLYLTPEARISSTFAGHYDLASYLVFFIPLVLSFYLFRNQRRYLALFFLCLLILIYTVSRISFIAYILTVFSFLILLKKFRLSLTIFVLTVILITATGEMTERFLRTFQIRTILVDEKTGAVYIGQKITTKELPAGTFYLKLGQQEQKALAKIKQEIKKVPNRNKEEFNIETFKQEIIQKKIQEAAATGKITEEKKEVYIATLSANIKPVNTIVSDISFATRLQIEWPRAINALMKNPFLGTGPSSLTEATDNDYLRWLGEFGLLGTLSFFLILFFILKETFLSLKNKFQDQNLLLAGFAFGLGALLVNATYIDVFEASKVAFTFWMIAGLLVGFRKLAIKNESH
ncbi:MAG: O-antigen ligase family protein [Patescibacteria group bacterium]|nr:O-antigen ligase family protein [Patescibacteria group bacterium]